MQNQDHQITLLIKTSLAEQAFGGAKFSRSLNKDYTRTREQVPSLGTPAPSSPVTSIITPTFLSSSSWRNLLHFRALVSPSSVAEDDTQDQETQNTGSSKCHYQVEPPCHKPDHIH